MKKTVAVILLVLGLGTGTSWAQWLAVNPTLQEGIMAFHLSGIIDDDGEDLGADMSVAAGQFWMDYLELGWRLNLALRGSDFRTFSAAGYAEQNFDLGTQLVPYAGGSLGLGYFKTPADDDVFLEMQGYGGARYFFMDYAAVGAEFVLKLATSDVYNRGEDSVDWQVRIRTTWYF